MIEELHLSKIGRAVDQLGSYDAPAIFLGLWAIPGGLVWLAWRPPVRFVARASAQAAG